MFHTKNKKYGYKGVETSFSGIVQWLDKKGFYTEGKYNDFLLKCCRLLIEYADEFNIEYSKKRSLGNKGDDISVSINKMQRFTHFTNWFIGKYGDN